MNDWSTGFTQEADKKLLDGNAVPSETTVGKNNRRYEGPYRGNIAEQGQSDFYRIEEFVTSWVARAT